jgi:aminoglycoside N3'-acetyltransferase
MESRKNEDVFEIVMLTYRVENNALLVTVAKDVERDKVNGQEFIELLKRLKAQNGDRICVLSDVTHTRPLSKEMREFFNDGMSECVKALAMFSSSKLGNAMAFIYQTMNGDAFASKVCENEQEAREWLKKYLG